MCVFDLFLEGTKVIVGLARGVVTLHGEVLDVKVPQEDCFCGNTSISRSIGKGSRKRCAITGIVRAGDEAEDAGGVCHAD